MNLIFYEIFDGLNGGGRGIPSVVHTSDGTTYHGDSSYDFRNPHRSSLIVVASVVGMPWGKPL
jgi:hypothetical protein